MHLACLGTQHRMLNFLKQGPNICRLSPRQRSEISEKHSLLSGAMQREFIRQPRPLTELDKWRSLEKSQHCLEYKGLTTDAEVSDDNEMADGTVTGKRKGKPKVYEDCVSGML